MPAPPTRRCYQFRLRTLLIVVAVIPVLILACDRSAVRTADGHVDTEMRYEVVDSETDRTIPNATVEFDDNFGFPGSDKHRVKLKTDSNGSVSRVYRHAGCSWRTGALGLSEKFTAGGGVEWVLRISCTGYETTDWLFPNTREFDWRSEYLGNHKARATIRVPLRRLAPTQAQAQ